MASPSPSSSPAPASSEIRSPSRRSSFGFLHRSKSRERLRKTSGAKIIKARTSQTNDEELRRLQANPMPHGVPRLPEFTPSPNLQSFGGENLRPHHTSSETADRRPMEARNGNIPIPPVPAAKSQSPPIMDPYPRAESMTHRGRYSYATSMVSSIDSPRRVRRRKDPTPFNVLVVGARNSGKTSFMNFLRSSLANKKRSNRPHDNAEPVMASAKTNRNFVPHYLETEIDGERVGLTLWDSPGLEKSMVDLQLREMSSFIQSKFEDTFSEETKVFRASAVQDTHIHCVFLILDPARLDANIEAGQKSKSSPRNQKKHGSPTSVAGALDEDFDIQVLRTLRGKTSVIPVISKADTVTTGHMTFLKRKVDQSLKRSGLDPLEALRLDDDDYSEEGDEEVRTLDERDEDEGFSKMENAGSDSPHGGPSPHTSDSETLPQSRLTPAPSRPTSNQRSSVNGNLLSGRSAISDRLPLLPYSILSPDRYSLESGEDGGGPVGRSFPWGFADPYNPQHCDFTKLKDSCFGEWRADLREASKDVWYERWRTSRLNAQGSGRGGAGKAEPGPGPGPTMATTAGAGAGASSVSGVRKGSGGGNGSGVGTGVGNGSGIVLGEKR